MQHTSNIKHTNLSDANWLEFVDKCLRIVIFLEILFGKYRQAGILPETKFVGVVDAIYMLPGRPTQSSRLLWEACT